MMETSIITQGGTKATISRPITMALDWPMQMTAPVEWVRVFPNT